jgi:hypothetical protein
MSTFIGFLEFAGWLSVAAAAFAAFLGTIALMARQ